MNATPPASLIALASELASLVPSMVLDSPLNNAHLIQGKLEAEFGSLVAEAYSWEAACRAPMELLPCGHKEHFAHTEDGGKTIHCYVCQLRNAESLIQALQGQALMSAMQ